MCNFNKIVFSLDAACPFCLHVHRNEVNILHPFIYSNGKKNISKAYHCAKCGFNFTPTLYNQLAKGEEERIAKARLLFDETRLVYLKKSDEKVFGYSFVQKKQIKKIELSADPVHILNDVFVGKEPTNFLKVGQENNLYIVEKPEQGYLPLVKVFHPKINYEEMYVPFELINFSITPRLFFHCEECRTFLVGEEMKRSMCPDCLRKY